MDNQLLNTTLPDNISDHDAFRAACQMLAPYIAGNDKVKTMSSFAMGHMIHDHFPQLSRQEVYLAITTVEQAHKIERIQEILDEDFRKGW